MLCQVIFLKNDNFLFGYETGEIFLELERNNHLPTSPETLCAWHQPFFWLLKEISRINTSLKTLAVCQMFVFHPFALFTLHSGSSQKSAISSPAGLNTCLLKFVSLSPPALGSYMNSDDANGDGGNDNCIISKTKIKGFSQSHSCPGLPVALEFVTDGRHKY